MTGADTDIVLFCPECGSPSLEISSPLIQDVRGSICTCLSCEWSGREVDLLKMPVSHGFEGKDGIIRAMMNDMKNSLATTFTPVFGRFLLRWGFLTQPVSIAQVRRYTVAIAGAVIQAVIQERQKLENESDGRTKSS